MIHSGQELISYTLKADYFYTGVNLYGAMTLSIMTLSIMTLSITTLRIMTLIIMALSITINKMRHSAQTTSRFSQMGSNQL